MLGCYALRPQRDYRVLLFLFFDHIGGLDTLFRSLMNGSTLVIASQRKPEVIAQLIERLKVDVLPMTPTALNLLILSGAHEDYDFGSLKIISYGAEPMPEWLLKRLHALFPWVQLQQKFGVSEMHVLRVKSESSDSLAMKIEDEHSAYKIVNGELLLKTECPIIGYLNVDRSPFDVEGWFHTGDLVESYENGFMRVKGRASEVINVGGEKVLPIDVETVLMEMPEIVDCSVFATPNGITGQMVEASVVLRKGLPVDGFRERIRRFCRARLEPFAVPAKIDFVDSIQTSVRLKKMRLN
jgi:acyl-coenzyme A synthetase/AMP-(fatty) acid ligase